MIRYIDSKEVLDAIQGHMWKRQEDKDLATEIVENTPTEDLVKHGHWIYQGPFVWYRCSVCRHESVGKLSYCGHCGAKMDEVIE